MRRTIFVVVSVALLLCVALMAGLILVVFAEEPVVPQPGAEVSFGWVVVSWLIYSIAGLIASVSSGKSFDGYKFVRTFLFTLLVAILAISLHLTPVQVTTAYAPVLEQVVGFLLNTGPGMILIYAFNKLYEVIMNVKAKLEAEKQAQAQIAATSPTKT